jgi:Domain of unknown function (DUF4328)
MYRLEPPGRLGGALRILLIVTGVVGLVVDLAVAAFISTHDFILNIPPRGQSYPPPRFTYTGSPLLGWLWLPSLVSYATIIVWLIWQHRATANLWARGYLGLRIKPGWAVGWWFVPFANYGMPLVAMLELDRRSTPDCLPRKSSPLLGWWWAAWLSYQLIPVLAIWGVAFSELVHLAQQVNRNTTQIDMTNLAHRIAPWLGVAGTIQLVAAVLAFFVVERIDQAQNTMFAAVFALPPRPDF